MKHLPVYLPSNLTHTHTHHQSTLHTRKWQDYKGDPMLPEFPDYNVQRGLCLLEGTFVSACVVLKCFALGLSAKALRGALHWIAKAKFILKGKD